ncbi:MAG: glycosyltransferase family 2 protein [Bacteroidales bacterium]|nr:glycosyltransferase family 2 protein [Bacteroidales bacterium]
MKQTPFFSVVIATYNRAELLKRALESLIRQTEKEWEGIIVDDGSTDGTYKKILPFLQSYPQLKYLTKLHSGEVPSKNHGIKASTGKYITFLDSDDEYLPSHLETRKEFLMKNPEVRFLHGGIKILGNQFVPDINNPSRKIHLNDCVIGGTFFIERKTLLSLEGFHEMTLGSDNDLFQRAGVNMIKMAVIDNPTYVYHHENPDSVTNSILMASGDRYSD